MRLDEMMIKLKEYDMNLPVLEKTKREKLVYFIKKNFKRVSRFYRKVKHKLY